MLFQCLQPNRRVNDLRVPVSYVLSDPIDVDGRPRPVQTNGLSDSTEHIVQGVPLQAVKAVKEIVFFIDPDMILSKFLGDSPYSDNPLKQLYSRGQSRVLGFPYWTQSKFLWTALMVAQQISDDNRAQLSIEDMDFCVARICEAYNGWYSAPGRVPKLQDSEDFIWRLRYEQNLLNIVLKNKEQRYYSAFAPESSEFEIEIVIFGAAIQAAGTLPSGMDSPWHAA